MVAVTCSWADADNNIVMITGKTRGTHYISGIIVNACCKFIQSSKEPGVMISLLEMISYYHCYHY